MFRGRGTDGWRPRSPCSRGGGNRLHRDARAWVRGSAHAVPGVVGARAGDVRGGLVRDVPGGRRRVERFGVPRLLAVRGDPERALPRHGRAVPADPAASRRARPPAAPGGGHGLRRLEGLRRPARGGTAREGAPARQGRLRRRERAVPHLAALRVPGLLPVARRHRVVGVADEGPAGAARSDGRDGHHRDRGDRGGHRVGRRRGLRRRATVLREPRGRHRADVRRVPPGHESPRPGDGARRSPSRTAFPGHEPGARAGKEEEAAGGCGLL